jgi:hypothetical protein
MNLAGCIERGLASCPIVWKDDATKNLPSEREHEKEAQGVAQSDEDSDQWDISWGGCPLSLLDTFILADFDAMSKENTMQGHRVCLFRGRKERYPLL